MQSVTAAYLQDLGVTVRGNVRGRSWITVCVKPSVDWICAVADMNVTAEFRFPRVNLREKPVVCHAGAGREPIRANFKPTSAFAFRI